MAKSSGFWYGGDMRTHPECISCFHRQVKEASSLLGIPKESTAVMTKALDVYLEQYPMDSCPPLMAAFIQRLLVLHSDKADPYGEIKRDSNAHAMAVFDEMLSMVATSADPLRSAVVLSCAGNIIDFGVSPNGVHVQAEIAAIMEDLASHVAESAGDLFRIESLQRSLAQARRLLYIGDNAGEIVFDRVLIQTIRQRYPDIEIWFATRGMPILNDVLIEDASACGIDTVAQVISSGVPTAGLVLSEASPRFLELYDSCDLIISKGQGNFEALNETGGPIFFLFITKCQVIRREVGSAMRQIVLI